MVAEIFAGLGAFKTMMDLAKGRKDINDATVRNGVVIELQEQILTAQAQQSALLEHVGALEKEVAGHEAWEAQEKRYKLTDYGSGTFAYGLKPDASGGEPAHSACPRCFKNRKISVLQATGRNFFQQETKHCPECKTTFELGVRRDRDIEIHRDDPFAHRR